jgi:hypothetical protein
MRDHQPTGRRERAAGSNANGSVRHDGGFAPILSGVAMLAIGGALAALAPPRFATGIAVLFPMWVAVVWRADGYRSREILPWLIPLVAIAAVTLMGSLAIRLTGGLVVIACSLALAFFDGARARWLRAVRRYRDPHSDAVRDLWDIANSLKANFDDYAASGDADRLHGRTLVLQKQIGLSVPADPRTQAAMGLLDSYVATLISLTDDPRSQSPEGVESLNVAWVRFRDALNELDPR